MPAPSLTLTTYDSAAAFRDRAEPFLMGQEAANNLMLGLTHTLITAPQQFPATPYLATVEHDGDVVAAYLRTPPYNLLLSTTDMPAALDLVAERLHAAGSALPGVTGPAALSHVFAGLWQRQTGAHFRLARSTRAFALRQVRPVTGVAGAIRRASHDQRTLLLHWMTAFSHDIGEEAAPDRLAPAVDARLEQELGGFWLWEVAGEPVSMVGATGLTPNGVRIAPVYTPPEHRRRGYASAATAAVSQHLLDAGRTFCFLFTDLANPTANHIYQEIGYEPVCDVESYEFRL